MYQYSPQMYGTEWDSYIGISNLAKVVGSEQLNVVEPTKSPLNIVTSPLPTPPGFCASATKSHVSFEPQQHDNQHQIEIPATWCFEFPKTTTDSHNIPRLASGDNFTTKQDRPSSQFTTSFCPVAESFLSSSNGEDCRSSSENFCKFPSYSEKYSDIQPASMPYYDHFSQEDDKLLRDDAATEERPLEISFQTNQLKQTPHRLCGVAAVACGNSGCRRGKKRIRWTKDLHEPFMTIVNSLGGPEKAKPKAILQMMKSDLLSISHVKSHLQKCRSTIHTDKALQKRSEEGQRTDGVAELQVKIHMQIEESRQLQLEVRRNIRQQLEMQQNLQMLIQQQNQQLKVMLDYQKKRTKLEKTLDTELEATIPK